jgi:hypothetical protein
MNVIYPPNPIPLNGKPKVFLAGSIEMGKAEDWQAIVIRQLAGYDVNILNPRRPDWDSTWVQDESFAPFRDQVLWEQEGLHRAEITIFNFCADTKSPITLLELGIALGRIKQYPYVHVCCPRAFYRHSNVAITCKFFGVNVHETLSEVIELAKDDINNHNILNK